MSFGVMILGFSLYLVGPWTKLGFPNDIWITIFGIAVLGIGCAGSYILTLPSMIERVCYEEGYVNDDQLCDNLAGVLTLSNSTG